MPVCPRPVSRQAARWTEKPSLSLGAWTSLWASELGPSNFRMQMQSAFVLVSLSRVQSQLRGSRSFLSPFEKGSGQRPASGRAEQAPPNAIGTASGSPQPPLPGGCLKPDSLSPAHAWSVEFGVSKRIDRIACTLSTLYSSFQPHLTFPERQATSSPSLCSSNQINVHPQMFVIHVLLSFLKRVNRDLEA